MGLRSPLLAIAAISLFGAPAFGADLGGTCCSDLEDRIAELEATTARKGNRKITLVIDGQINEAYTYVSMGDNHKGLIGENGNDRSFVGFSGVAKISKDLSAGFRLEVDLQELGLLGAPIGGRDLKTRQSYWFIKSESMGKVGVGRQAEASNDLDKWSTNNAWLAGKPLSLGSLSDLYLTGIDVPFDGTYRDVVRYDSPLWEGLGLSATWGTSTNFSGGNDNSYDVALRYAHDWDQFKVTGAAAYRHSTDMQIDLLDITSIVLATGDVNTFLVNGSVLHVPTGVFLNASYDNQDWTDANFRLVGLDVTGGLQEKWNSLGKTEVFGSWGRIEFNPDAAKAPTRDIDYYGFGLTQAIDSAAMDLYLGYRHYNTGDLGLSDNVDTVSGGARIRF